jgi:hypothetical protein
MSTRRWMIFVAVVAISLATLTLLRRWTSAKVIAFLQQVREQSALPPDSALADFNVPVTRDMMFWIQFDQFLNRFWIVLLALIMIISLAVLGSRRRKV